MSCYDSVVNNNDSFDKKTIEKYQKDLQDYYTNPESTPLKEGEKEGFKGITFFPIAEKYFLNAKIELIQNGDTVAMPTSAQKIKRYITYARLSFKIDNIELQLLAYIPVPSDKTSVMKDIDLFVPFKDLTNGLTSYGGGRYIDLNTKGIKEGYISLDFNKAYNPYCAYSIFYNCPIPPNDNHLKIEILAGASYED